MPGPVAISEERLTDRVDRLADAVAADASDDLVLVALLPEAAPLCRRLAARTGAPVEGVRVSRFRPGSAGARVDLDGTLSVTGRDVVVAVTIIDTGLRARLVVQTLAHQRPRSLSICALLDRRDRRLAHDLPLRHVGFTVPDTLFCGFGLGGQHASLPALYFADDAAAELARRRRLAIA